MFKRVTANEASNRCSLLKNGQPLITTKKLATADQYLSGQPLITTKSGQPLMTT